MNVLFFDGVDWDYDVSTPAKRPLGGSQSALCYLALALARRGHQMTALTGTTRPGEVSGVRCVSTIGFGGELFAEPYDALVVLNGPAELALRIRPRLHPGTPLVLWTQHAVDQPAMRRLQEPAVRAAWDAVVGISQWHRATLLDAFGLEPGRVCVLQNAVAPCFEGLFRAPEELARAKTARLILAYTSTPFRGLDVLLALFPRLRQEHPGVELHVYSSMKVYHEADEDRFAALYERCRTTPGIAYRGSIPQPQLAEALQEVSVLSYPNTFAETGCIAAMEAMAAGAYVVTSDLGALPETTMGLATLVPPLTSAGDAARFVGQYFGALDAVLRRRAADPAGFAAARFEQVRQVNARCTWTERARQWEAAIADWQRSLPGRGTAVQAAPRKRMSIPAALELARQHWAAGRLVETETVCQAILQASPQEAEALGLLGSLANALQGQGRHEEAGRIYRQLIAADPAQAAAYNNLGTVLQATGRPREALALHRQALALRPDYVDALANLASALQALGRFEEAMQTHQQVLAMAPANAVAHNNYGLMLATLGRPAEARDAFGRALALQPRYSKALKNLGVVLQSQGLSEEAEEAARQALALEPAGAANFSLLGSALLFQGRLAEALAAYRQARTLAPDDATVHSQELMCQQYLPEVTPAGLAAVHAEWDRQHAAPLRAAWRPPAHAHDPGRRLRLGFLSQDFGYHPVGYFLVRVLENLDPRECETVCYSDQVLKDDLTRRLVAAAGSWHEARGLNDDELAEQIQGDRIEILFDLGSHTSSRLLLLARKPAPLQITWIAYPGTSGLEAMDYILADRYEIPPGDEAHYREHVLRMPESYVCYDPPGDVPPVGPLPAQSRGYLTFGSFNNPAKLNAEVIDLWTQILRRVPGSRLVLKYRGLQGSGTRRRYHQEFAGRGIDPQRLELQGFTTHGELLGQYQQIDLALDPFPYSGGLTTCEALWMGVPVVTCPGQTFAGRHSLSHLSSAGLTETIARDRAEYVELAVRLAGDVAHLATLRAGLRGQMTASPLCDGRRFAADLLRLLREITEGLRS